VGTYCHATEHLLNQKPLIEFLEIVFLAKKKIVKHNLPYIHCSKDAVRKDFTYFAIYRAPNKKNQLWSHWLL